MRPSRTPKQARDQRPAISPLAGAGIQDTPAAAEDSNRGFGAKPRLDMPLGRKKTPDHAAAKPAVRKEVVFQVEAPTAGIVALAAEFTNWEKAPIRMLRLGEGIWQAKVALPQGRHRYKFLVDGRWLEELSSPERIPNPFGTTDGVIDVP
jgi:1,4-alpha-glucan branching enzyme